MKKLLNYCRNLMLLSLCFAYLPIRGRAKKSSLPVRTFAVFHRGKLGDMVCATPVFRAIKKARPDARVIVFGDATNRAVVAGNEDVDEYVTIQKKAAMRNSKLLRNSHADHAILLTPGGEDLASLFLSGIPAIVVPKVRNGYSPYNTCFYRMLSTLAETAPHTMGSYAPREYLRLLEPSGIISDDVTKHLFFSENAVKKVGQFLEERGIVSAHGSKRARYVCVAPGAGNWVKRWPAERFGELIKRMVTDHGVNVVTIGGKGDKEAVQTVNEVIRDFSGRQLIHDAGGIFDIDELKALIARSAALIGVDTGPIYIAEAFGVPTVDIIGPVDEKEQPPRGDSHVNVIAPRKKPELYVLNAREYDVREAQRQVEDISVGMVAEAFSVLFPKNGI